MTADRQYQETVDGIALARRTVEQTSATIRQAMDNGDDPVIFLHNLAASLGKESPFQAGGQGAAIYVVACFLLAESGFFETTPHDRCICPGPEDGEPTEYLATCPIHRGSWAETLEILADREVMADLGEREDEDDPIDAEDLRGAMEARHAEPCCPNHHVQCTSVDICCFRCPDAVDADEICMDPDCGHPECDGDHDSLRCPTTGFVRGNIATVNGKWICCGGDYPNHASLVAPEPCCGHHGNLCHISEGCCPECPEAAE